MGKSDVVSQAPKARKASIMPIRNLPKAKEAVKGITKLSPSAVGEKIQNLFLEILTDQLLKV